MDVRWIPVKLKQRLNKLASNDYDNLECWQVIEAFNKGQLEWSRANLHGGNQYREGDEQSRRRIDDFQVLLKTETLRGTNRDIFYESESLPKDYFLFKRAYVYASTEECSHQRIRCNLLEEANADIFLDDPSVNPSFEWRETFCTLVGDKVRVYTSGKFVVESLELLYYKYPTPINLSGCKDINEIPGTDVDPVFKDDVVEVILDVAASIIAGDTQDINAFQITEQRTQKNN